MVPSLTSGNHYNHLCLFDTSLLVLKYFPALINPSLLCTFPTQDLEPALLVSPNGFNYQNLIPLMFFFFSSLTPNLCFPLHLLPSGSIQWSILSWTILKGKSHSSHTHTQIKVIIWKQASSYKWMRGEKQSIHTLPTASLLFVCHYIACQASWKMWVYFWVWSDDCCWKFTYTAPFSVDVQYTWTRWKLSPGQVCPLSRIQLSHFSINDNCGSSLEGVYHINLKNSFPLIHVNLSNHHFPKEVSWPPF